MHTRLSPVSAATAVLLQLSPCEVLWRGTTRRPLCLQGPSFDAESGGARVVLEITHARDVALQHTISQDDARVLAAISRGDRGYADDAGCPPRQTRALDHDAGQVSSPAQPPSCSADWLERARARDAALQARIARADTIVRSVYRD